MTLGGDQFTAGGSDSYLTLALCVSKQVGISLAEAKSLTLLQAWQALGAELKHGNR